jgi:hypothetical protein
VKNFLLIVERVVLTLWVGSLWAVGLMVAPVLFTQLDDRAVAGSLAGSLFTLTALIGLVGGSVLLISHILRTRRYDWQAWVITAMLLSVAVGQFVLAPMIGDVRSAGLADSAQFARLHGLASLLFLVTSGLGLLLVATGRTGSN